MPLPAPLSVFETSATREQVDAWQAGDAWSELSELRVPFRCAPQVAATFDGLASAGGGAWAVGTRDGDIVVGLGRSNAYRIGATTRALTLTGRGGFAASARASDGAIWLAGSSRIAEARVVGDALQVDDVATSTVFGPVIDVGLREGPDGAELIMLTGHDNLVLRHTAVAGVEVVAELEGYRNADFDHGFGRVTMAADGTAYAVKGAELVEVRPTGEVSVHQLEQEATALAHDPDLGLVLSYGSAIGEGAFTWPEGRRLVNFGFGTYSMLIRDRFLYRIGGSRVLKRYALDVDGRECEPLSIGGQIYNHLRQADNRILVVPFVSAQASAAIAVID